MKWTERLAGIFGNRRAIAGEQLWYQPATTSGITVTPETSLTFSAVFSAINVLATDVSSLSRSVYKRNPDGSKSPACDHPVHRLVHTTPDGGTTPAGRWHQALMGHVLGWGNGYAEIERKGNGQAVGLHLLDPSTTKACRRPDRSVVYEIESGKKTLLAENVLHVAGLGFDGLTGYSPIKMARQSIGLAMAAETYGASFFGNSAIPKGALKVPQKLSEATIKSLREAWQSIYGGPRSAGKIAILEGGAEWIKTSIDPEDAQFLLTRNFQRTEIAALYRVPPHKIGDYSQAHLANVEESNLDYVMTALTPWAIAIEQAYNLRLFTPAESQVFYVEHNLTSLLRGNMAARAAFYTSLFNIGVLSINDIMALENRNGIGPDGDRRFVPLNMVPLDQAGKPDPKIMSARMKLLSRSWWKTGFTAADPAVLPEGPEAEPADESGEWFDGNQLYSLKNLCLDVSAGRLPAETAKAIITAAFPGMEASLIDAMITPLADFQPAAA